jgi:phosphate starvation-inducible PhoH-like protein
MGKNKINEFKDIPKFYKPKSINQEKYFKCLNDDNNKIIFAIGPAGTGKTALACNNAIKDFKNGKYKKIIITRPVVPVEEEIGFLPGTLNKKMDPWIRPIIDIFLEFYSQKEIDNMFYNNLIEISPLGFMRGRTFKNAIIIADEMQNSSPNQMMMLTTRIGEGSKMVITGDLKQKDKLTNTSGLFDIITRIKNYEEKSYLNNNTNISNFTNGIKVVELDKSDIERHPIITKILDIYEENSVFESKKDVIQEKNNEIFTNSTTKINDNDCALIPKHLINKHMLFHNENLIL